MLHGLVFVAGKVGNKMRFRIDRPDDEKMEIWLNNKCIGSYNHDVDGWVGLEKAEMLVRCIANQLNIEVIETFDEE